MSNCKSTCFSPGAQDRQDRAVNEADDESHVAHVPTHRLDKTSGAEKKKIFQILKSR